MTKLHIWLIANYSLEQLVNRDDCHKYFPKFLLPPTLHSIDNQDLSQSFIVYNLKKSNYQSKMPSLFNLSILIFFFTESKISQFQVMVQITYKRPNVISTDFQ